MTLLFKSVHENDHMSPKPGTPAFECKIPQLGSDISAFDYIYRFLCSVLGVLVIPLLTLGK